MSNAPSQDLLMSSSLGAIPSPVKKSLCERRNKGHFDNESTNASAEISDNGSPGVKVLGEKPRP